MIDIVKSDDGSCTAFSSEYNEHYHSTKDGALNETLYKHVIPAMMHVRDRDAITILDICFGLGFNTLTTLYYLDQQRWNKKVRIISPELDEALVRSLETFEYPEIFAPYRPVIEALSRHLEYQAPNLHVTIVPGDARKYLVTCKEYFDVVYQDAFSPQANPMLWTVEYFSQIARVLRPEGILTTYSTALQTRLALYENGFGVYINEGTGFRNATLASRHSLHYKCVDMKHKIACNPLVIPLRDSQVNC